MIRERYCSFDVSKLLKEKGFDESIHEFYDSSGKVLYARNKEGFRLSELGGVHYPHITHQFAMDWLREIYKLHIEIYANASGYKFIISKPGGDGTDLVTDVEGPNDGNAWDDYKDVVEAALEFCLIELI